MTRYSDPDPDEDDEDRPDIEAQVAFKGDFNEDEDDE